MSDIFISHCNQDKDLAIALAKGLEEKGYTAWYYERDATPGMDHITESSEIIDSCGAVLLIISEHSIESNEVDLEVDWTHLKRKNFLPVLTGITWDEFEKHQKRWRVILGAVVGINTSLEEVSSSIPRLVNGLKRMGIFPLLEPVQDILNTYPYPLAGVYARKLIQLPAPEKAFQIHQDYENVFITLVKYLTAHLLAIYRKQSLSGDKDGEIERGIAKLRNSKLENWLALLQAGLKERWLAQDHLLKQINNFYNEDRYHSDKVSEAIERLQGWMKIANPEKSNYSAKDFIDVLFTYQEHALGWGGKSQVLEPSQYQERIITIRLGLEALLKDLKFLCDYPLTYVGGAAGGEEKQYEGMGNELRIRLPALAGPSGAPLLPNHVYLHGKDNFHLDLYPLLIGQDCMECSQFRTFYLGFTQEGRAEWSSYSCNHHMILSEQQKRDLEMFISGNPTESRENNSKPFIKILREVMADGEITPDEQKQLDLLSKALDIPGDEVTRLKIEVRDEFFSALITAIDDQLAAGEITAQGRERIDAIATEQNIQQEAVTRILAQEEGMILPFIKRIRELFVNGGIPVEGQKELEELAKGLGIPSGTAARLQAQVKPPTPPTDDTRVKIHDQVDKTGKVSGKNQVDTEHRFIEQAKIPLEAPILAVAVLSSQYAVFYAEETGQVSINGQKGKLYQDHFEGRVRNVITHRDQFLAGTWDGHVYCFDQRHLCWQSHLEGVVACLDCFEETCYAGTWDGQVWALRIRDGHQLWAQGLKDAISTLTVSSDGKLVSAGTYDGQIAILDSKGETNWLREVDAGVVRMFFINHDRDLLVVSINGRLTCFKVANQEILWQEDLPIAPASASLSPDERRLLVASRTGDVISFNLDGKNVRASLPVADLSSIILLPLAAGGDLALAASRTRGLLVLDLQAEKISVEDPGYVSLAALSPDSSLVAAAKSEALVIYRLARPDLRLNVKSQEAMQRGRFSRIQILVENKGERVARDISIRFEGPFDFKYMKFPLKLDDELAPGASITLDKYSIQPKDAGAVPMEYVLEYTDEYGLKHTTEDNQVIDILSA